MPHSYSDTLPSRPFEPSQAGSLPVAGATTTTVPRWWKRRDALLALWLALAVLVIVELAVQLRSQWRYGQSVFNRATQTSRYLFDPVTGLNLLRPNTRFEARQQSMVTNGYGLRGPAPPLARPPGGLRLAVLGASTAMGAYATSDATTVAAWLQQALARALPDREVEVINAGVAGLTLAEQARLLDRLLWRFSPDAIVVMPGTNDMAGYCRPSPTTQAQPQALWAPSANGWSLSYELLRKNTVLLKSALVGPAGRKDPRRVDPKAFTAGLQTLMNKAAERGIPLVLTTNSRAFRRDQAPALQRRFSESARFYSPCFDLEGLHELLDRHNSLLVDAATARSVGVVRLDLTVPGGEHWFADAGHFTDEGNRLAAAAIAQHLLSTDLLD